VEEWDGRAKESPPHLSPSLHTPASPVLDGENKWRRRRPSGVGEEARSLEQRRCGGVRAGGEKRLLSSRRCAVADHGLVLAAAPSAPWTVGANRERAVEKPGLRPDLHRSSWTRSRSPRCCYLRETKKR